MPCSRTLAKGLAWIIIVSTASGHQDASVMDNNGAILSGIQRVLGHSDRRSTEIYLERLRDVERDAMDVYERESRRMMAKSHSDLTHAAHTQ